MRSTPVAKRGERPCSALGIAATVLDMLLLVSTKRMASLATVPDMEIVVLGAGGIGTVCAAFLARAGPSVRRGARAQQLAAVRDHGLQVRGLAEFDVAVEAVDATAGPCDALVLA